jgi:PAP2 superfamily
MRYATAFAFAAVLASGTPAAIRAVGIHGNGSVSAGPIIYWSLQAQRAVVPPGPAGIFGPENYGNKFPGEAAVYMGIVHAAIYDAAVAIEGGYERYALSTAAPHGTSSEAAIATAVHHTLVGSPAIGLRGLQPALGLSPEQQARLDATYDDYMNAIPEGAAKSDGIRIGEQVAVAISMLRQNDGREANPTLADLNPPAAAPGVWEQNFGSPLPPVLGLRLPGITPLALVSASQFRPDGPNALTSTAYAEDFNQVKDLGRDQSTTRTPEQTSQALFWTDHDLRQWNEGMLRLAAARGLDLMDTARMLAMAHVSGADAMIACFDAKFSYWFWRPYQAIPRADSDGNPATIADVDWRPLRTTPNFPEYPSAHACHSGAVATALREFFGTDHVTFWLDSRITGTTRAYDTFHDVVRDVNEARVLAGFHFRNADQEGANLGRNVARFVAANLFRPLGWRHASRFAPGPFFGPIKQTHQPNK